MDGDKIFGIMTCSKCDRIIWWLMPSKRGAAPFLSADLKLPFFEVVDSSLRTLELVLAWEEELDMAIPDEDAEKLNSVEDVLEYMKRHRQK